MSTDRSFRFAVNVTPKAGILDPQGRAVEQSLPHLGVDGVHSIRVGRRVELTVDAPDEASGRAVVDGLARELLSNPLIETYAIEAIEAIGSSAGGAEPVAVAGAVGAAAGAVGAAAPPSPGEGQRG
jgi:phosphoribosylformylglycinamidine synthase PurS subunit